MAQDLSKELEEAQRLLQRVRDVLADTGLSAGRKVYLIRELVHTVACGEPLKQWRPRIADFMKPKDG